MLSASGGWLPHCSAFTTTSIQTHIPPGFRQTVDVSSCAYQVWEQDLGAEQAQAAELRFQSEERVAAMNADCQVGEGREGLGQVG